MSYPGPVPHPTLEDRLAELDRTVESYRGNNAQYADLIRSTVSVARLAITELLDDLAALEAAHDRALERKDAELRRLQGATTLAQMRATPSDDDALVRVTFAPPASGWRTEHLQDMYVRLKEAGSDDLDLLDFTATKDVVKVAGLVADPDNMRLTFPEPRPAPLVVDTPQFDEPPDPWRIAHGAPVTRKSAALVISILALAIALMDYFNLGILA